MDGITHSAVLSLHVPLRSPIDVFEIPEDDVKRKEQLIPRFDLGLEDERC